MNSPTNKATAGMISRHGILSRENSMTSGKPWVLRPTTLKPRDPREPAEVVLAAMSPVISSRVDESAVAMTKTMITVSHVVVKTALNPSVLNHSKSTKKRLNTASITKITMIDAASMRNVFFISLITEGLISRSLLCKSYSQSPSFPNAAIGNPGETGTGPPIKTFGGDAFGINSHRYVLIPRQLAAG